MKNSFYLACIIVSMIATSKNHCMQEKENVMDKVAAKKCLIELANHIQQQEDPKMNSLLRGLYIMSKTNQTRRNVSFKEASEAMYTVFCYIEKQGENEHIKNMVRDIYTISTIKKGNTKKLAAAL